MNPPLLDGRCALVTGASGGIGGAVALALAGAGAELVVTYSSHRGDVEAVARSVRELGSPEPHVIQADLGVPDAGRRLATQVADDIGNIDVLVANAGVGRPLRWDQVDDEPGTTPLPSTSPRPGSSRRPRCPLCSSGHSDASCSSPRSRRSPAGCSGRTTPPAKRRSTGSYTTSRPGSPVTGSPSTRLPRR